MISLNTAAVVKSGSRSETIRANFLRSSMLAPHFGISARGKAIDECLLLVVRPITAFKKISKRSNNNVTVYWQYFC